VVGDDGEGGGRAALTRRILIGLVLGALVGVALNALDLNDWLPSDHPFRSFLVDG
jgi:hypothetical protein